MPPGFEPRRVLPQVPLPPPRRHEEDREDTGSARSEAAAHLFEELAPDPSTSLRVHHGGRAEDGAGDH